MASVHSVPLKFSEEIPDSEEGAMVVFRIHDSGAIEGVHGIGFPPALVEARRYEHKALTEIVLVIARPTAS